MKTKTTHKAATVFKLLLVGLATTAVRIVGQLMIPAGEQAVLGPSVFAQNGAMPLAFTIYGLLAYTLIAALFLLLRDRLGGRKLLQGLRYALACCAVWVVYLWEPLPHVAPLDRLTYPLADCAALLVMGLLLGALLGCSSAPPPPRVQIPWKAVLCVTLCFVAGRLLQYLAFDSYSLFVEEPLWTLLWCALTGMVTALALAWCARFLPAGGRVRHALLLGGLLFGLDLALFNGFMPLVFAADLPDLLLRTAVDLLAVTAGCLAFPPAQEPA